MTANDRLIIDGLQYCNWSEKIFRELSGGGVSAIHVTICYHENFRETISNIGQWNRWFQDFPELICPAYSADDVRRAKQGRRTAVIFGFQNPAPIEDDLALIEIWHRLGVRFMQLSYNNQSLIATGCYEAEDPGITRMGREVIREMNRVGLVIDMSHSAERSTLETIELSSRPIAITHANPASWHPVVRNKSDTVLRALGQSGGMLGLSLYPLHLKGGSGCSLRSFCEMVARTAEIMGIGEYRDRFGPLSGSAGFGCRMDACRPLDARLARSFVIARGCGVSAAAGMVSQQHTIWQHCRRTGGSGLCRLGDRPDHGRQLAQFLRTIV